VVFVRKSTLDELIAYLAQFNQQSMLWICAVIITGMQLWDRIDDQPAGVFDTLIKFYFDRPQRARLLSGFWSSNRRRFCFIAGRSGRRRPAGEKSLSLLHVHLGFDPNHLATLSVMAPGTVYTSDEQTAALYREIERRVSALPGWRLGWSAPSEHRR
jgi:hypothetical protein